MSDVYYTQLCATLGILKSNNIDLPWDIIDNELRTAASNRSHDEYAAKHWRYYRNMALDAGLLKIGELASLKDIIPLKLKN